MTNPFEIESPKRAALYIRVSTDEQVEHGNGMQIQEEALLKYADSQNFSLNTTHHIYRDE
jgi:DNA invertase Pin-like site-specific DNA recombinase